VEVGTITVHQPTIPGLGSHTTLAVLSLPHLEVLQIPRLLDMVMPRLILEAICLRLMVNIEEFRLCLLLLHRRGVSHRCRLGKRGDVSLLSFLINYYATLSYLLLGLASSTATMSPIPQKAVIPPAAAGPPVPVVTGLFGSLSLCFDLDSIFIKLQPQ
jgi:hypothetical protein